MRSLVFAALLLVPTSASADKCDTTKESNVRAAYKQATGKELPKSGGCIRLSSTFAGLVWIGSFANDVGCEQVGVLVGCELSPKGYEAKAMAAAGWAKADGKGKQALALAWLTEIEDFSVVNSKPEKFPKKFSEPLLVNGKDGTSTIDLWTADPVGMRPGRTYHHVKITFAADGTHGKPAESETADTQ